MTRTRKKQKRTESNVPVGPSPKSSRKTSPKMKATAGGAVFANSSTEITRPFPFDDDDDAMTVDPSNRVLPDDALSSLINLLAKKLTEHWRDDGTDTAINDVLHTVFVVLAFQTGRGCPPSFLTTHEGRLISEDRFLNNVNATKERDPDFFKSLGKAIRGQNKELWRSVLMHGTSLS